MELTPEQEYDNQQRWIDRYQQARSSLWNALLTFNGIILSVIFALKAIDAKMVNEREITSIVILCSISIFLIIINYFFITKVFYHFGQLQPSNYYADKDPNEEWDKYLDDYKRRVKKVSKLGFYIPFIIEWLVGLFFLGELVLFLFFIFN